MIAPSKLATIAGIILVAGIPVVLLVSPLYILATPAFVRHEYSRRAFPPADRFGDDERLQLSDSILAYLRGRKSREALAAVHTEGGEIALADDEVQHLADVKKVMDAMFLAHAVANLLVVICALLLWCSPQRHLLPVRLRQGVWLIAALIGVVVVSASLDFDLFFTRFHQMFFAPGTWVFDPRDTLIQLYPLPFWTDAVAKIAAVICLELGLVYGLSIALERSGWLQGG